MRAKGGMRLVEREVGPAGPDGRRAITEVYKLDGLGMVTWQATQDGETCEICRLRHGKRYRADRVPERHENCRCILVPDP